MCVSQTSSSTSPRPEARAVRVCFGHASVFVAAHEVHSADSLCDLCHPVEVRDHRNFMRNGDPNPDNIASFFYYLADGPAGRSAMPKPVGQLICDKDVDFLARHPVPTGPGALA